MAITQITDYVIFGTATDQKPLAGIPTQSLFFEVDTGRTYKFTGGVWSLFAGDNKTETLTNKTLINPTIASINNGGTITLPTGAGTLVTRSSTDTLTNKTLTAPIISTIFNGGTITLPTGTRTLIARDTIDTILNKTINVNSNTLSATAQAAGDILVNNGTQFIRLGRGNNGQVLTSTASTVQWLDVGTGGAGSGASPAAANTWSAIQTFNDGMLALRNPANTFSVTLKAGAQTADRTYTFPVSAADTIVLLTTAQTMLNKTIPIDTNIIKHTSTNAAGDILVNNGTQYTRFAKGTANQVLAVDNAANLLTWTSLNAERTGTATGTGTGSATTFQVEHGLGSIPFMAFIQCSSHSTPFTFTYDETNINVTFTSAPASGATIKFQWRAVA